MAAVLRAARKVDRALRAGALAVGAEVEITTVPGYLPQINDSTLNALFKANAIPVTRVSSGTTDLKKNADVDVKADSYIKPEMAKALFNRVGAPEKQFWSVPTAKHNQALNVAPVEYAKRLVDFFDDHLGDIPESRVVLPKPVIVTDEVEAVPVRLRHAATE